MEPYRSREIKPADIKKFLLGWLLEFGSGPVGDERFTSLWYQHENRIHLKTVNNPHFRAYFTRVNYEVSETYQLNQAGLDFIKEK